MLNLPRAVVLEGFKFKVKLDQEPFEEDGFYLLFIKNRTFGLVKIHADQIQIDDQKYRQLSDYENQSRIFYKLESKYIDDDIDPERQVQFKGKIGSLYKLNDDLNNNTLRPVELNQPSVIYRPRVRSRVRSRGRARVRSRSRSRGGNKKTKKYRKKT